MRKILLIDDEDAILRVLSMSLKADGYEVLTANSGNEGLDLFKKESPELVLTDIKMPGMDGLEVLKNIKKMAPDAEVIIITGHGDIDSAIEALQLGASDFINKPVKDQALSIALKRAQEKLKIRGQLTSYTNDLEQMVEIATQEFERKSNFQAKLIKSSNDGIVATDEDWKIAVFNPGAERIFGYKRLEVIRKTDARDLYNPAIMDFFDKSADQNSNTQELPWQEITILSKDGENIPVRFSGTFLKENKKMIGSVAFFQDLREIKRLEKELVASERLGAIGQTVAGLAHCIKNILHGFKGGSYLVDLGIDKGDNNKLISGWGTIKRNINRTSDLVLDLLSYSKEREPDWKNCFPNQIADDAIELLSGIAEKHDIEITKDLSTDIKEVMMDPSVVHRILMNLVSNAIDACLFDDVTDKKHLVSISTSKDGNNIIKLEVRDNGSGMTDEVKAKLFTSFFSTKGGQGTGLGLLVTKKLIEEHDGTIKVKSKHHEGTTFSVRLSYKPNKPYK